jgi:type I site-specific restriction endonuclease
MKRNAFALFGAVAVLLTATVALTLSRATLSEGGSNLKCYDLKGGIERCSTVDRPPLVVRTSVRHAGLD